MSVPPHHPQNTPPTWVSDLRSTNAQRPSTPRVTTGIGNNLRPPCPHFPPRRPPPEIRPPLDLSLRPSINVRFSARCSRLRRRRTRARLRFRTLLLELADRLAHDLPGPRSQLPQASPRARSGRHRLPRTSRARHRRLPRRLQRS